MHPALQSWPTSRLLLSTRFLQDDPRLSTASTSEAQEARVMAIESEDLLSSQSRAAQTAGGLSIDRANRSASPANTCVSCGRYRSAFREPTILVHHRRPAPGSRDPGVGVLSGLPAFRGELVFVGTRLLRTCRRGERRRAGNPPLGRTDSTGTARRRILVIRRSDFGVRAG